MFPKLFSFDTPGFLRSFLPNQITIYSYGVMIGIGILVCFYVALAKSKKLGMTSDKLSNLFILSIIAAFVGGKLFFYFEDFGPYLKDPSKMFKFSGGGFVFYGSLIFVVPTIILYLRKIKIAPRPFLDVLAFVGPIIHSFGRVGCFLAGCCHGKVCDSPIGVTYSNPETLANPKNVPLYPTQLFDIGVNLIILGVIIYLSRRKQFNGQLFMIYLSIYAIGRSIIEVYRGDEARGFVFGNVSHSQFIAFIVLIISGIVYYNWYKKAKEVNK